MNTGHPVAFAHGPGVCAAGDGGASGLRPLRRRPPRLACGARPPQLQERATACEGGLSFAGLSSVGAAAASAAAATAAAGGPQQRLRRRGARAQAPSQLACHAPRAAQPAAVAEREAAADAASEDSWVAPQVVARGPTGDVTVALGAVEKLEDGKEWLHGFVWSAESEQWLPVLLLRKGLETWEGDCVSFDLSLDAMAAAAFPERSRRPMAQLAPEWPESVLKTLDRWPLKGPGTVVMDPQFFMQRAAPLACRPSGGPVLFPGGARRLRLPSTGLARATSATVGERTLLEVLGHTGAEGSRLGEILGGVPDAIGRGHFDLARATSASSGAADGSGSELIEVALHDQPIGMQCEPRTWTCGAVVRTVLPGSEAERLGCRPGDVVRAVGGREVSREPLEEVDRLLKSPPPVRLALERPQLQDHLYLRETPACDEAVQVFAGPGQTAEDLVPEVARRIGGSHLFISERTPMLFAGDAGTASHVHIDNKPLIQFCHVLHGTKMFVVAPSAPWVSPDKSADKEHGEVTLPVDVPMGEDAREWLQRSDTSVCRSEPGDLFLFPGRKPHFGANGLGSLSVALFHGARRVRDMADGVFGPAFQQLAMRLH